MQGNTVYTLNPLFYRGTFYEHELKAIGKRSQLRLSGLVNTFQDENGTKHYVFNVETLPKNILVDIKSYELKKYKFTQKAMQQIQK